MAATIVVFENNKEMAMMSAEVCHDWRNQKEIFGSETQKLLDTCTELFHAALRYQVKEVEQQLLKKIFGIAKAHGLYITWYGNGRGPCEPDRFLVSGRGVERLAFIQCQFTTLEKKKNVFSFPRKGFLFFVYIYLII